MTTGIVLTGRWLHYGIEHKEGTLRQGVYSAQSWDQACAQAREWGMTGVTPKVADGGYTWYDDSGLSMLSATAKRHGLQIAPYHYVYGDKFGALQREAQIAAWIGQHFGVVIPDMEVEWFGHGDWMQTFGYSIRHNYNYQGPIVPTTFANPSVQSAFPYVQMNTWASAWIPQVYFNLWDFNGHRATAKDGIAYVLPQWNALDALCHTHGNGPLKPILPLIGLTNNVPAQEIGNWLAEMHGYGYCGFWYDGVYAPYAQTVSHAPMPALPGSQPAPTPSSPSAAMHVPKDWHDDGKALYGPEGEGPFVLGFRARVLGDPNWNPANTALGPQYYRQQLELSNPDLGDGDQILCKMSMHAYPHHPKDTRLQDKVIDEYVGSEVAALRQQNLAQQQQITQLTQEIADLGATKDAQYLAVIQQLQHDLTQTEAQMQAILNTISTMANLATSVLASIPAPSAPAPVGGGTPQ